MNVINALYGAMTAKQAATATPKAAATASNTPPLKTDTANQLASKDMFLQLLVAQLKHQDPLSPTDGTQFVSQLAQFTTLEQTTQMRSDLDAILEQFKAASAATKV